MTVLCQYCVNIMPVLCQYYVSIMSILCQYYDSVVSVLSVCVNIMSILRQYYVSTMSILCQYYGSIVSVLSVLCQYCVNIMSLLCQYYVSIMTVVSVLCQYCVNIMSVLCQYYVSIIIPAPENQVMRKTMPKTIDKTPSLESHLKETLTKSKLKVEKEGNSKYITKKKQGGAPNFVFPDLHKDSEEHTQCGLCGLKYCSVHFVLQGGWIRCQKCDTW